MWPVAFNKVFKKAALRLNKRFLLQWDLYFLHKKIKCSKVKLTILLADYGMCLSLLVYRDYLYIFSSVLQLEWHTISAHTLFPSPPPPSAKSVQIQSKNSFSAQRQRRQKINPNTDKTCMVGHVKTCTYFRMNSE